MSKTLRTIIIVAFWVLGILAFILGQHSIQGPPDKGPAVCFHGNAVYSTSIEKGC